MIGLARPPRRGAPGVKRLLRLGERRFEIELAIGRSPLQLGDRLRTVALLRSLAVDAVNRDQRRRVLADGALAGTVRRLDDAALIEQIATLLGSGRAVLQEAPPGPPLTGFDDADESLPPPAPQTTSEPKLTWIEIVLVGEDDKPIPGEAYRIELPDGSTQDGWLDGKGFARVDGIDPGNCQVTFPRLDKDAWKRI
jgi:hypothetical protein